jgi:hypothetical protein
MVPDPSVRSQQRRHARSRELAAEGDEADPMSDRATHEREHGITRKTLRLFVETTQPGSRVTVELDDMPIPAEFDGYDQELKDTLVERWFGHHVMGHVTFGWEEVKP